MSEYFPHPSTNRATHNIPNSSINPQTKKFRRRLRSLLLTSLLPALLTTSALAAQSCKCQDRSGKEPQWDDRTCECCENKVGSADCYTRAIFGTVSASCPGRNNQCSAEGTGCLGEWLLFFLFFLYDSTNMNMDKEEVETVGRGKLMWCCDTQMVRRFISAARVRDCLARSAGSR
jgi:hypothetical protein